MFIRALDIGGSQTRIATNSSVQIYDSTNQEIAIDAKCQQMIDDKRSDFIIAQATRKSIEGRRYVKGSARLYYHGNIVVTDNQSPKVTQDATYINAIYAIALELMKAGISADTVRLGVCIPTAEFFADTTDYIGMLKEQLTGTHVVEFPLLEKVVSFEIPDGNISVFPEGVVAAFSYIKDPTLKKGITLIVDAGYRSTDITLLRDFKPIGKGARSLPIGGINLEAILSGELERRGIFMSSKEDTRDGLCSGYLMLGSEKKDISDIVQKTEEIFASMMATSIVDVLSYSMMNMSSINNLIFVGRPFTGVAERSLSTLLYDALGTTAVVYPVPDKGTANVTAMAAALSHGG